MPGCRTGTPRPLLPCQALVLLLAEDDDALASAAWAGCDALAATIPKDAAPRYVGGLKEALAGAHEKERRKRRGGPLHLRGLLLPSKPLAPFVPIYLQGVLQVRARGACAWLQGRGGGGY
jgi:hypothetical protein